MSATTDLAELRESMEDVAAQCDGLVGMPGANCSIADVAKMLRALVDGEGFVFIPARHAARIARTTTGGE